MNRHRVRRRLAAGALALVVLAAGAACSSDDAADDDAAPASSTSSTSSTAPSTTTSRPAVDDPRRDQLVAAIEGSGISAEDAACIADESLTSLTSEEIDVLLTIPPGAGEADLSPEQLEVLEATFRIAATTCDVDPLAGEAAP